MNDRETALSRASSARAYARAKARGACLYCKARPQVEGHAGCEPCLTRRRKGGGPTQQRCSACGEARHKAPACPYQDLPRCACGLLLPCHGCGPTARELAESRPHAE